MMSLRFGVLEHLPDTTKALRVIHKALKPKGGFLIKTVSCTSLLDLIARALYHFSFGKIQSPLKQMYVPGHLYYYTKSNLYRYLDQEGWNVSLVIQSDTPVEALFRSAILRNVFKKIYVLQNWTNSCYELLLACHKKQ